MAKKKKTGDAKAPKASKRAALIAGTLSVTAPSDPAPESDAAITPRAGTPVRKSTPPKRAAAPKKSAPLKATAPTAPLPKVAAPKKRSVPPPPPSSAVELQDQIKELEAKLDKMIDEASQRHLPSTGDDDDDEAEFETRKTIPMPRPSQAKEPPASAGPPSSRTLQSLQSETAAVFDTARELLSTDYYLQHWGRLGMRGRSEEVDDFGYDPVYEERFRPFFNFLYSTYFRVETEGIEHVPGEGRCLLVANHSGTLPYDGVMLKTAMKREHPQHRDVRWLAEDFIFHFPFLGSFTNRIGAVRACQENAERLLKQEALVAVFPEGVKGIGKLFKERYRLQRFGRGGFIKLGLRTRTPIVPVAIIGAEETNPMLFRIEAFSRALGVPYIPVTPTFPALGPLGLAPAPTKWKIVFGEKISLAEHGPEAADDDILVTQLAERVRASVQSMVDRAVGARRSVFFG